MIFLFLLLGAIVLVVGLYAGKGYWAWVSALAVWLATWWLTGVQSPLAFKFSVAATISAALVFGLPSIRRYLVSAPAMRLVRAILPTMGDTERIALALRSPFDLASPKLAPEFLAQRGPKGALAVNRRNPAYPLVVATALDALAAAEGSYVKAAKALGLTTSQLLRLLRSDPHVWRAVKDGGQG